MDRFDDDEMPGDFDDALEFDELDENDSDPQLEQLIARVHAARLAGA